MERALKVKIVGNSWDLRMPPAFARANNLRDGDYLVVDLTKLRIVRAEDFAMIGRAPVLETTE
jgi:hypothetical protein